MKDIKKREIELLARVCKQNDLPIPLASDLIKTAKKFAYETVSSSQRVTEYLDIVTYHSKNQ